MEKKTRNTYRKHSQEFKQEAVELATKTNNSDAARQLGLDESQIRAWKNQLKDKNTDPNKKSYEDLEKENKRLAKELLYMKEINKILKKSTAILSQDLMENLK